MLLKISTIAFRHPLVTNLLLRCFLMRIMRMIMQLVALFPESLSLLEAHLPFGRVNVRDASPLAPTARSLLQ